MDGKIKNPFYAVHDMIWDGDVTPEAGMIQYKNKFLFADRAVDYFVTSGILALDEDTNISPLIYALQTGIYTDVFGHNLKTAFAYYNIDGIKQTAYTRVSPDNLVRTNTLSGDKFVNNYRILDANIEYPVLDVDLFGKGRIMPLSLVGAYVKNLAGGVNKDAAWFSGFQFGKAGEPGNWEFAYNYRRIAADATLDFLNDGAFHGGGTNAKGSKVSLRCTPAKNTDFTITYFNTEKISGAKASGDVLETLQIDFGVKF
jgi:hypothetical protein